MNETDLNRLRRQVSFDRLLARLFRDAAPPWFLKGGYALELRYKAARSTVDIDFTVQRIAVSAGEEQNQIVREMLQYAADVSLGDWFEFTFGPPTMDLTAAPYAALAIQSKLAWTNGSSPGSTSTPELGRWCRRR